jgi:hypothetical protein
MPRANALVEDLLTRLAVSEAAGPSSQSTPPVWVRAPPLPPRAPKRAGKRPMFRLFVPVGQENR